MSEVFEVIKGRRSFRHFKKDMPCDDDVWTILEMANHAPRGGRGGYPWGFIVIKREETKQLMVQVIQEKRDEIAQRLPVEERKAFHIYTWFSQAPIVIALLYRRLHWAGLHYLEKAEVNLGPDYHGLFEVGLISASMAAQNLMLAAHALGLATCYVNAPLVAKTELERILGIERPWQLMALIPLGYPGDSEPPEARGQRKKVKEITRFIE
ncbi:MAG: nitroreductase family protein [Candidatus Bathyarchaeia archaeon]